MTVQTLLLVKLGAIFICFFLALVSIVAASASVLDAILRRKEEYERSLNENCQIIDHIVQSSLS